MKVKEFLEVMGDYFDKEITVICADGQELKGCLFDYASALDNEPDGESITIRNGNFQTEIPTEDIKDIEIE